MLPSLWLSTTLPSNENINASLFDKNVIVTEIHACIACIIGDN